MSRKQLPSSLLDELSNIPAVLQKFRFQSFPELLFFEKCTIDTLLFPQGAEQAIRTNLPAHWS